jgi:hypothetical protein
LTVALVLLAIFFVQELAEGLLASGHPAGLEGVFGGGGLWAVPSALLLGSLVAMSLWGADALVARLAAARQPSARPRPAARTHSSRVDFDLIKLPPLATLAAGRAPPPPPEQI